MQNSVWSVCIVRGDPGWVFHLIVGSSALLEERGTYDLQVMSYDVDAIILR
jgi:hypothetical protein